MGDDNSMSEDLRDFVGGGGTTIARGGFNDGGGAGDYRADNNSLQLNYGNDAQYMRRANEDKDSYNNSFRHSGLFDSDEDRD